MGNTTELSDDGLLQRVAELGRVSEADAHDIANEIHEDGIVSRAEAEALFELNDRLSGTDPSWDARFCEAVKDYLLKVEAPIGWVNDEQCAWLIERISRDGDIRLASEVDLLLDVLRFAEGAPTLLGRFALEATCDHVRHAGRVSADNVGRLRRAVFAQASGGANWVTKWEADQLFALNDGIGRARNDKSWNDFFARAIGNYLMARAHPDPHDRREALAHEQWLQADSRGVGAIFTEAISSLTDGSWFSKLTYNTEKASRARQAAQDAAMRKTLEPDLEGEDWLMNRLGWDKSVTAAERALIDFLKAEVPGFTAGLIAAA